MTAQASTYNVTELVTPSWLISPQGGDNAWQLTAATLVGLQSVPGLMVLYAGLMKSKWAINSAFMVFYGFAATLIVWVLYAYRASFGNQMLPFVGVPNQAVTLDYELQQAALPTANVVANYGMATMTYFQFVFAAITINITAGAFLGRMNFLAWMIYVPLWITLSYTVGAFSIWGGGFLAQYGVLDYSGGYVIHLSSGTAGFVGAYWIGPRLLADRQDNRPSNIPICLVGAGILWLGWNGFNGGDPYTASPDAGAAVLNTNVCTAMSLIVWVICDYIYYGRASIIGAINGMITGLVAITPAAGFISGWASILLAIGSGSIPWFTMNIAHKRLRFLKAVDDSLGIYHTHLVASLIGGIGTGIYADGMGVAAFAATNSPGGGVSGYGKQIGIQIVGALFIIGWNAFWTSAILLFIKYVLRIPLRMSEEQLLKGDFLVHSEDAYVFSDDWRLSEIEGQEDPQMIGGPPKRHAPTKASESEEEAIKEA